MKKLVVFAVIAIALSGCDNDSHDFSGKIGISVVDKIWDAYIRHPGNADQGIRWVNVTGKMIKQGTVSPSAVNSSAQGRLPAYLACYDYVLVISGVGDTDADLCIYYIDNPTRGTSSIMWRGKKYMDQLGAHMVSDSFMAD